MRESSRSLGPLEKNVCRGEYFFQICFNICQYSIRNFIKEIRNKCNDNLNFSLLSNAGLPETNPLLLDQDLDNSVSEDFQKMLNEWENHIGSLQVRQDSYFI